MKKILIALAVTLGASLCFATISDSYEPEQYNANGSTTQFQIQWSFFDTSDLVVYHTDSDGVDTTLTEGSGAGKYTVYAPNSDYENGATITTGTTYPNGGKITIERSVPYGQELSINGDFVPAKPLETQLDKLAAQIQQTKDEIGRTVTIPVTDPTDTVTELPNAETRAGKVQAYDDNGDVTVVSLTDSGTIAVDDDTLELTTNNIIRIKASGVGDTEIEDASIQTDKVANLSTNITTSSQTNLVTEGAVKGYVDTEISTLGTATTNYVDSEVSTLGTSVTNYVDDSIYSSSANYFESSTTNWPASNGVVTFLHGLGSTPSWYVAVAVCTNASGGYAVGDETLILNSSGSTISHSLFANTTNVGFSAQGSLYVPDRASGQINLIGSTAFDLKIRAWK